MTSQQHERRSTFSATCSRLSQYIKDQGGLPARSPLPTTISLLPAETIVQPMDLFPQHAGFGSDAATVDKAQLTIFYGGRVLVFDEFPADKATDIMKMASAESSSVINSSLMADTPAQTTTNLPIARRASLHRFLHKRKDRINSKAPYQVAGSQDSSKPKATLPWFRLGEEVPKPASSSESCR